MNTHSRQENLLGSHWTRRGFLVRVGFGIAGLLALARLPRLNAEVTSINASRAVPDRPKANGAKSVIQIWLWGGPSHLDTFDPKPEAGPDYCGQFQNPIETSVPGVRICEALPELAKIADKYVLIRSLSHGINAHETAAYLVQTGWPPGGREVHPCIGAVVSLRKGYEAGYTGLLPPYIVLTQPQGRFSEAGFLGNKYKPFATGGNPAQTPFAVEGIVAPGISTARQLRRRQLLTQLDVIPTLLSNHPQVQLAVEAERQAYEMILGEGAKVFDLSTEPAAVRDRYGRNTFGQACLVARRLVEAGVPYITINYTGWDTHKQHFQTMRRMLPELDRGLATLLVDLDQRGLLASTVVWCCGEFGRTPRIQWEPPWNGGRGHWGHAFSALLAGGGIKGGQVLGATDAKGEYVKDRPVHPAELLATIYTLLGIDPHSTLPHPTGESVTVLPETTPDGRKVEPIRELIA